MDDKKVAKVAKKYYCEKCELSTINKYKITIISPLKIKQPR